MILTSLLGLLCIGTRPWLHAQSLPSAPGGFLELATSTDTRPLLSAPDLQALLPERGQFTFPAPYGTTGVRLTNGSDCGFGTDCVQPFGGTAWSHINNSAGSNVLYVVVGLDQIHGGTGPTLFRFNKTTGDTANLGPLFDAGDDLRYSDASTWYFSATQPTALYLGLDRTLRRMDVLSHTLSVVFDVTAQFGDDKEIWDPRSSNNDLVHSFGLASATNGRPLGCGVYREDTHQFTYFPALGTFLECAVDRSGLWLVIKEDQNNDGGEDNRIVDLVTGASSTLLDGAGAAGRTARQFGGMLTADDHQTVPNAIRRWLFGPLAPGAVVYHDLADQPQSFSYISFANARSAPLDTQFACGASASRTNGPRANEIVCVKLDGSLSTLVVAPVMTDLDAAGGGVNEYVKTPAGTIDPTGQYFLWTSNAMGGRMDAFLVNVPSGLLVAPPSDAVAPTVSITAPAQFATVNGSLPLTASASDNVGVAGVQFRMDGLVLGSELTAPPFALTWNTTTASEGIHVLTAVARDAAGNTTTSAPRSVTVVNGAPGPQISTLTVLGVRQSRAFISWTTNQLASAQVEYGPTLAYGSTTTLDPNLSKTHLQLLTGLTPGTLYHFRVASWNAEGYAAQTADFTFSTQAALTLGGITASASGTSVVVGWTTNLPSSSLIEYGLTSDYGDATDPGEALVLNHGVPVSGLALATTYHYRVYSSTLGGDLVVSADQTFTTSGLPAGPPSGAPGGFVELATSNSTRPVPSAESLQALLPVRGAFTLPAPYNTTAIRLTNGDDCGGLDCVRTPGGGSWRNMNNSTGSNFLYAVLGLDQAFGGGGPTLFRYDKVTGETLNLGPLFDTGDDLRWSDASGWYFSATLPTAYYVSIDRQLRRYDVLTHDFTVVFDISAQFGDDKEVWRVHSSNDDRVHSFLLRLAGNLSPLGCGVYREDTQQFSFFPSTTASECQVDKSGLWLLTKENANNRIIDLALGTATTLLDAQGAGGSSDNGFGAMLAADDHNAQPNALRLWTFGPLGPGPVVYSDLAGQPASFTNISFANARSAAFDQQFACGSAVNRTNGPRANEIVCVKLDGSLNTLVVAPTMTDLDAAGGVDDAGKQPIGNLDPTGEFFLWTSNTLGDRLDAFVVRVPSGLLVTPPADTTAPTVVINNPAPNATVSGSNVILSATAGDFVGVAGVQFKLDGVNLGTEQTSLPFAWNWNTFFTADGVHVLSAVARDAAGNTTTAVPVSVTIQNAPSAPQITGVSASGIEQTRALAGWTTNQLADSQVQFGLTTAYGSSTVLDTTLTKTHLQLLTGLSGGLTYHYRVISRNAQGAVTTSNDFTFTTETPLVISAVGTSSVFDVTARVSWSTNLASDSQVEYGQTTNYGDATEPAFALATAHSQVLSNLSPGTLYHFRVYSVSASGVVAVSNDFTFTTTTVPPPTLAGVQTTGVTGTSATVNWTTSQPANSRVEYHSTLRDISLDFVGTATAMSSGETAGVVPKAFWNSAAGASSASPLALVGENGAPTGATVTWSSDNTWATPSNNVPGDRRMMLGYLDTGNANPTTVTVSGLGAATYDIYVYVDGDNTEGGLGANRTGSYRISGSGITTTTINVTDPGVDFNGSFVQGTNSNGNYVKFSGVTATGFTLTATPGASSDEYLRAPVNGIQIIEVPGSTTLNPALETSHAEVLSGLAPGTTYKYRVYSTNAIGLTTVSNEFTFTTPASAPEPEPIADGAGLAEAPSHPAGEAEETAGPQPPK